MTKKENVVAIKDEHLPSTEVDIDFSADAGAGLEGADKDSFAIPFISALQGLSPQCETVDGAKPGLLINTVTNEVASTLRVVPVAFQRRYNRWVPRSAGGGFKGELSVAEVDALISSGQATRDEEDNKLLLGEDELVDTRNHFVLLLNEHGGWTPALISLSKTGIKRSKRWLSVINSIQKFDKANKPFTPPSFSHIYKVSTEKETNNDGSWFSMKFDLEAPVTNLELYNAAKAFHAQVAAGAVKTSPPQDHPEAGSGAGDSF